MSLKTILFVLGILPKKPTLVRLFKKAYKIRIVTVFLALAILILKFPSFDLIWGQFLSEEYQFDKNNPSLKNIF